jgi:mannose-6-phosphate isomerase-like protein (cupin superfamily)
VAGVAEVIVGMELQSLVTTIVRTNESIEIPLGAIHRVANRELDPLSIIEVQFGDYLGEDDIERLDDDYGRLSR